MRPVMSLPKIDAEIANAIAIHIQKCQTQYCSQILLLAQAAYSKHDYTEAAELVSMIDAQSSCATQAKALLNSIKKKWISSIMI